MQPPASSACRTASPIDSGLLRSSGSTVTDCAPAHVFATRSNSSFLLDEIIRRDPSRAKARASSSPIPLEAPVIQTTFPLNGEFGIDIYNNLHRKTGRYRAISSY